LFQAGGAFSDPPESAPCPGIGYHAKTLPCQQSARRLDLAHLLSCANQCEKSDSDECGKLVVNLTWQAYRARMSHGLSFTSLDVIRRDACNRHGGLNCSLAIRKSADA
jgi:hypothetical protein